MMTTPTKHSAHASMCYVMLPQMESIDPSNSMIQTEWYYTLAFDTFVTDEWNYPAISDRGLRIMAILVASVWITYDIQFDVNLGQFATRACQECPIRIMSLHSFSAKLFAHLHYDDDEYTELHTSKTHYFTFPAEQVFVNNHQPYAYIHRQRCYCYKCTTRGPGSFVRWFVHVVYHSRRVAIWCAI